ncbi:YiiX/YebB-like N1pC/P60 family cysteine hydrolase [Methanothrix soehngenii]|uniref:YiiX/YebB-like N1pC/P60 family cysteine hydrolase n=1 Tax=Methanothrix soehngenii TaxID=2223 RepID=UPI00300D4E15
MKKIFLLFCISVLLITIGWFVAHKNQSSKALSDLKKKAFDESLEGKNLKDGDIIFQTSLSSQSKAIQLATGSKYSHCGIIFKQGEDFFVFEAIQPVKSTPLMKWIERGENGKFVVKRLKNAEEVLNELMLALVYLLIAIRSRFYYNSNLILFLWPDRYSLRTVAK